MNHSARIHRDDLTHYASIVAKLMRPGVPILLSGPMGVGKSTFARGVLRAIIPGLSHVPSPSFPIMIPYDSPVGKIWHMDLYRIHHENDIAPLGLDEVMSADRCLIEWPDRLGRHMPPHYGAISLAFTNPVSLENKREDFGQTPGQKEDLKFEETGGLWRDLSIVWTSDSAEPT
jgi:tRNA threonylcarbamoyladenosine biosynthesis protein TsaE